MIEQIKTGREQLRAWLQERGYAVFDAGINLLAIHKTDATLNELNARPQSQPSAA